MSSDNQETTQLENSVETEIETEIFKNALLIGCDYEGSSNELKGCSNDVFLVRNLLTSIGYQSSLLCDDSERQLENVVCKPDSNNIIKHIEQFCNSCTDNSENSENLTVNQRIYTLFFHYSGHGTSVWDRTGDESDRKDEVIVPIDNKLITDDQLNEMFGHLPANANVCVLIDACFSGTALDLKYVMSNNGEDVIDNENNKIKCDMIMISGCMDSQTSADAWISQEMNDGSGRRRGDFQGAMTASFLDTYEKYGTNIKVKDFLNYMKDYLKKGRYQQIPQLSYSNECACDKLMSHYIN